VAADCGLVGRAGVQTSSASALPEDSRGFQGNRNARAVRYDSRCMVCRRACCRHLRTIDVTVGLACQLPEGRHLLPYRSAAVDSVGIKLDSNSRRVEAIKIDLNVKYVPLSNFDQIREQYGTDAAFTPRYKEMRGG